jgi:prepilin-type N-terminal cleavage/methylation domain-containing protein
MNVRTRPTLAGQRGFTLVELLVVLLILGILTMIMLPAFINQRLKGEDTEAQQMVRTVATALETFHTDRFTYDATIAELVAIEPAVGEATGDLEVSGDEDEFEISETSASGTEFTLARDEHRTVTRSCTVAGRGLCRAGNRW